MEVKALKVRPKNHPFPIIAWLIMIFQKMNPFSIKAWSHNAIAYSFYGGSSLVIDSTSDGVRIWPEEIFFEKYKLVGYKNLTPPKEKKDLELWINGILGRDYDKSQILGIALKVLGLATFNFLGSNYKKLTCNEVILNYLEVINGFMIGDPDNFDLNMTWEIIPGLMGDINERSFFEND